MPRTLSDDLVDDVGRTFLATDHFAELATYTPLDGVPRTITIVIHDDELRRDDQQAHRLESRTLRLSVARSASDGIDNPQRNEKLVRVAEPTVVWSLARVIDADAAVYDLEFTASTLTHSGQFRPQTL